MAKNWTSENTCIVVVVTPHVVRQLVTQDSPHLLVCPEAFVVVRPQPQLDSLTGADIEAQQLWMLVRSQLCKRSNGELVLLHDMTNRGILCELRQQLASGLRIRQMR